MQISRRTFMNLSALNVLCGSAFLEAVSLKEKR